MPSPEESESRKLAAIMFTDVKSFSKKMGENEEAAMELLRTHDSIMKQVVEKYGGKVIKSIGDSFMVDFSSAVNAVRCAIEAQETFWNHNQGKTEFEKIEIRIGIHLGDVITVGNDIYGDGVNIAARIEAITEPNRICVSQDIYNQIKNKMQINAFSIGSMELKNIAEPVEVFEILIDSIAELSKPSASAQKAPSRRAAEAITKQEAQEAKKVEEAKQKAAEERRKADEAKQNIIQTHYTKAQEYLQAKELEKAEAEVKEIYKVVAIHPGAQMVQMKIDEERFRIAEEERRQRIEEENRKAHERAQQIDESLKKALEFVEQDQLAEALNVVQGVYELDPNHWEAKKLEERIRQLEQEKIEIEQAKAQAEAEQAKEEAVALEARPEIKPRVQREAPSRVEIERKKKKNILLTIAAGAGILMVALVALYFTVPDLQKLLAGKASSVAVLPFEVRGSRTEEKYLGDVIAAFCAENLGRSTQLFVISPFTAATFDPGKTNTASIAKELGVQDIITGSVAESNGRVTLELKLMNAEKGESVWQEKFEGELVSSQLWLDVLNAVHRELGIPLTVSDSPSGTNNSQANEAYLKALWYVQREFKDSLPAAINLIQHSLEIDSSFPNARALQALVYLEMFKRGGEWDKSLVREALQSAQAALRLKPDLPLAYTSMGEAYRYLQRLSDAKSSLSKSLSLHPNNAEANRQLALVALTEGDLDLATGYASTALKLDPKYYETHLVLGLINHMKNQFGPALSSYERAIALGGNDSLITTRYRFGAWSGEYLHDRIDNYCIPLLQRHPDDYRLYYWIARAYQLSGRGLNSLTYLEDGIANVQKLLEQDSNNSNARAYLGFMLYLSGKTEQGVAEIEKAASSNEGSAEGMYWRARINTIQNKKAEALSWLKKAVETDFQFAQVLNPDFATLARDPEFLTTVARKTAPAAQTDK